MSKRWQVVEKTSNGTDYALVRSDDFTIMQQFESENDALAAATRHLTKENCDNALTPDAKRDAFECYMMTKNGCFLGVLDGRDWYLTYPKDVMRRNRETNELEVVNRKGEVIMDDGYYELGGKTIVSVRPVPGT